MNLQLKLVHRFQVPQNHSVPDYMKHFQNVPFSHSLHLSLILQPLRFFLLPARSRFRLHFHCNSPLPSHHQNQPAYLPPALKDLRKLLPDSALSPVAESVRLILLLRSLNSQNLPVSVRFPSSFYCSLHQTH